MLIAMRYISKIFNGGFTDHNVHIYLRKKDYLHLSKHFKHMSTILKINARNLDEATVRDLKEHYGNAELEIRVNEQPDAAAVMGETEFWPLIALLDWSDQEDNDQVTEPLVTSLSNMPVAKIYQFHDILFTFCIGKYVILKLEENSPIFSPTLRLCKVT